MNRWDTNASYSYTCLDCTHAGRFKRNEYMVCDKFNMYVPKHVFENANKECKDFEDDIPF